MKTIDLTRGERMLAEGLVLPSHERILIRYAASDDFLLEPADAFDREAALLGQGERFVSSLLDRWKRSSAACFTEDKKLHRRRRVMWT